ncbi:MalY/PatB family protein [Demequina lignilytica]|uniref:cysteine-S-conjugate beta-lyase n=1 Tax=Demequina lignilytica TaxID=3051663 RepID=A0AB35MHZ5_9MICO|nr:aminotransferase class I/II-fold pyridoxal phosphate-dependent enzyme [Demequina sp. SYSU T0a273]MDN4483352.1 aminotransferase class I/II-fold pyridoxal phosphate-dependent enzyme [Demequina sp. SYSU T0a273]
MTADPFDVPLSRLRERTSAKWRHYAPDVLPLWVAEMDVDLAEPIQEALVRAVRDGDLGYPGSTPYAEAFVGFARRWDWPGLDASRVIPVQSVILGYVDALLEHTDAGSAVIVNSPVYPPFYSYLIQAGREIVEAPLDASLRLDPDAIERAMSEATAGGRRAAYLLCNPHNPGGTAHTRAELQTLADLSRRHGVPVVSDEIHAPVVHAGHEFVPYVTVDPTAVALHAASKAFNLAAVPAALMVGGVESGPLLDAFRAGKHHAPAHLGVIAQTAAYLHGDEWLTGMLAGLERNRFLVRDLLAEHAPGVDYRVPEATYLTWLDFGDALGEDPAAVLLERGRVALNRGLDFGTGGAGHARLNIATSPEILAEAARRIGTALAGS